ncbi:MAG TPA: PHP domain-containing protein [Actinobacteria bacterium]|nr:PHP domain-containing protein [Actinomycetota bacterium]
MKEYLKNKKNSQEKNKSYENTDIVRYECDLHCHTDRSDGNDTPLEFILKAKEANMKAVAITDHDITPPLFIEDENGKKIFSVIFAKENNVDLVLGYEFSCDTNVDDVHILGYKCDWENRAIINESLRAKKSKSDAYRKLCIILSENGYEIDFDLDILQYRDENNQARTRKPEEVEKKLIFETMAKKGFAPTWQDAKIMVRDNPVFNIKREKINPADAIKIIKDAGGIAVLAHPYLIDESVASKESGKMTRYDYICRLIDAGLDGIESTYTYDKTSYKGSMSPGEIKKEVEEIFGGKVRFFTGGSDYHNDGKKGVKNPRMMGEAGISYKEFVKIFY